MLRLSVLIALSLSLTLADNANKVTFILDFLKSQTKPTNLVVWRNCFDESEQFELIKRSPLFTTLNKQDSLSESDFGENPQYWLFALDLTCTSAPEKISQKVNSCRSASLSLSLLAFQLTQSLHTQIDTALLSHPYRWIMFAAANDDDKVLSTFRALVDSDVLIVQATNDGFALRQFYKIDSNSSEIHYENYGRWSEQTGVVDERSIKVISKRRENLRGKLITTSYVALNKDSLNHLTDFVDKNVDSILKLNYIIVNLVLDKLNATRKELFQATWGYYNAKSKKWSGMMGDIVQKGADIGGKTTATVRRDE